MTILTIEYSLRKFELDTGSLTTSAARLASIGGIDFDKDAPSVSRFGTQLLEKATPRRIHDGLSQTVVFVHVVDTQIFYRYQAVAIDNLAALLMGEVLAFSPLTGLAVLASLRWAFANAFSLWRKKRGFSMA
jgi:hypothetical protein